MRPSGNKQLVYEAFGFYATRACMMLPHCMMLSRDDFSSVWLVFLLKFGISKEERVKVIKNLGRNLRLDELENLFRSYLLPHGYICLTLQQQSYYSTFPE
jgi:hypothetical protein